MDKYPSTPNSTEYRV